MLFSQGILKNEFRGRLALHNPLNDAPLRILDGDGPVFRLDGAVGPENCLDDGLGRQASTDSLEVRSHLAALRTHLVAGQARGRGGTEDDGPPACVAGRPRVGEQFLHERVTVGDFAAGVEP